MRCRHYVWVKRLPRFRMNKLRKIIVRFALPAILAGVSFMVQASVDMPGALVGQLSLAADPAYPIPQFQQEGKIQLAARMVGRRSIKFSGRRGSRRISARSNTNSQAESGADRRHVNFTSHLVPKSSTTSTAAAPLPPTLSPTINTFSPSQSKNGGSRKRGHGQQAKPVKMKKRSHKRRGRVSKRKHRKHSHGRGRRHR